MTAIHLHQIATEDGEITVKGLPVKKGQAVDMILLSGFSDSPQRPRPTARQFIDSGLLGLWQDRDDIDDSASYARQLREQAQNRRG